MILDVCIPFLAAGVLAVCAPWLTTVLPPRQATWLFSVGAVVTATTGLVSLAVLGWTWLGRLPFVAAEGHWSSASLQHAGLPDAGVSGGALVAALITFAAAATVAVRRVRALQDAYRSCRRLTTGDVELVVVNDDEIGALAIPGRPGRIVLSRRLLTELTPRQRKAVLAHERSHLRHGHHWHRSVVAVCAAINPLLRGLPAATAQAVERWADEDAAAEIGSRADVAATLQHVSASVPGLPTRVGAALAVIGARVQERMVALAVGPPRNQPVILLVAAAAMLVALVATVDTARDTEHIFEAAMRATRRG